MFLLFYAAFHACWHYLYLHIFELRPQVPSHSSIIGGAFLLESIIWCTQIVCCPLFGGCLLFGSSKCIESTGIAVGASTIVRYTVDVRYWECPLTKVPLYINASHIRLTSHLFTIYITTTSHNTTLLYSTSLCSTVIPEMNANFASHFAGTF